MGYRLYFGRVPKKGNSWLRKASHDELAKKFADPEDAEDGKLNFRSASFPLLEELHCVGKRPNFNYSHLKNFFAFEDQDEDFLLADKEFLAMVIDSYRESTYEYYKSMRDVMLPILKSKTPGEDLTKLIDSAKNPESIDSDAYKKFEALEAIRTKLHTAVFEWAKDVKGHTQMYDLNDLDSTDDFMTASWSYEYTIFNLIYLYKTFDWKKYYLIFYGY